MIGVPLGDRDRKPLRFPIITALLILANVAVFCVEVVEGDPFITRWVLIPAHIASAHGVATIFTSMFMHASWFHILGNMVFLWAFGPEIEDAMGLMRYLAFYLLGGVAAALCQVAVSPGSNIAILGASGAIAAVMGAFIVTYPRDRIRVLLVIFVFVTVALVPAAILIGLWFLLQLFSGVGSLAGHQSGEVAYMAHVGGFLFGAIAARAFERRSPPAGYLIDKGPP